MRTAIALAAALALCVGACKKTEPVAAPPAPQPVDATIAPITDRNDEPAGLWKDPKTGCWYIIEDTKGGITPEMGHDGRQLCDD